MISRRELLTASVAGGFTSTAGAAPASSAGAAQDNSADLRRISGEINGLDSTITKAWLSNAVVFGHAERVRNQFETFFRINQKFPDFIDVGLAVFLDLHDWHIKNRQPLQITRGPDSRYWMQFMFSTIILRGEHEPTYIGIPYDKA
jgi:hypothetical protein